MLILFLSIFKIYLFYNIYNDIYFFHNIIFFRFSMYPPSMLSSAALAAAAHSLDAGDGEIDGGGLDLGLLVKKLQVYTRVENVSIFIYII